MIEPRYEATKVLDSSDETGYVVLDRRLGYLPICPPHLARLEAIQLAERMNQEANHEGGSRMVELNG